MRRFTKGEHSLSVRENTDCFKILINMIRSSEAYTVRPCIFTRTVYHEPIFKTPISISFFTFPSSVHVNPSRLTFLFSISITPPSLLLYFIVVLESSLSSFRHLLCLHSFLSTSSLLLLSLHPLIANKFLFSSTGYG